MQPQQISGEDANEPTTLYKYCSVAREGMGRLGQALQQNRIYYAGIDQFNDPFETRVSVTYDAPYELKVAHAKTHIMNENPDLSEEEAVERAPEKIASVEQSGYANLKERLRTGTGIFCLSEKRDDILMWSHYACKHTGVCIEFSATEEAHVDFVGQAFRVDYQDSVPSVNLYRTSPEVRAKATILTKSRHWSYEREWRVIDFGGPSGHRPIPPRLISSIILGVRCTDDTRRTIKQLLRGLAWRVELQKARMSDARYELEIVPD